MTVRLDKWLWAARFFKTRSRARQAVLGGKIEVNGQRAKPARTLAAGDRLQVQRGDSLWEVEVLALSERRGPATEAATLYAEFPESIARREAEAESRRQQGRQEPARRPDKRQRRQIVQFRRGDS